MPGLYWQAVHTQWFFLSFSWYHSRPVLLDIMVWDNESCNSVLPPPTQVQPLSPLSLHTNRRTQKSCQSCRWDGDSPGADRGSVYEHVDILVCLSQASFLLIIYLQRAWGWSGGYARILASITSQRWYIQWPTWHSQQTACRVTLPRGCAHYCWPGFTQSSWHNMLESFCTQATSSWSSSLLCHFLGVYILKYCVTDHRTGSAIPLH